MKEINPIVWFSKRELGNIPRHFAKAQTPKTEESYIWVLTKLQGRFGVSSDELFTTSQYFFFEDPAEAMIYELRWSGD